jgi:ABC-type lipoprotein export system ATPase subunit
LEYFFITFLFNVNNIYLIYNFTYLNLLYINIIIETLIIHISGASGSGKTTLGNKLKEQFKNKILMKDLDD